MCSEICGVLHGFMPTVIESVSLPDYLNWVDSMFILPFYTFVNKKNN